MWIFIRFLSEHYGHESVLRVWENAVDYNGYDAWDAALAEEDTTLGTLFRDFGVALLTRAFEEGEAYPLVRLEGVVGNDESFQPGDGVAQMAVDYIEVQANGPVSVQLNTTDLQGWLVGIDGAQASLFPMPAGQGSVDASAFQHLYLMVLNLQEPKGESDCRFSDYSVTTQPGGEGQQAISAFNAVNFQAPHVENMKDP
jgi:hypothetical protein